MKAARIVIIAKAPVAGFCKTRLVPALGAQGAAQLAQRMLGHTVATALAAQLGPVELCVTPARQAFDWPGLDLPEGLEWTEQGEGDLGARMARATQRVTADGTPILLIGTDCPALDAALLRQAAAALHQHEAAMLPTLDGGYALLGLRQHHPRLFEAMPWSTADVAAQTRQRLAELGWQLHTLPTLPDIDEPHDLRWLPAAWRAHLPPPSPSTP